MNNSFKNLNIIFIKLKNLILQKVVLLSIDQFAVFVMASSNANTGILCALPTQFRPVLDECSHIVKEVASGQVAQIVGQSPRR